MRVAKISRRGFAQMRVRMHQCVDTFLQNLSEDNMQAAGRHPRLSPPGSGRAGRFAGLGMKEVPAQCPLLTQTTVTPVCQGRVGAAELSDGAEEQPPRSSLQDGLSEDLFGAFEAQLENDDDDSQVELTLMNLESSVTGEQPPRSSPQDGLSEELLGAFDVQLEDDDSVSLSCRLSPLSLPPLPHCVGAATCRQSSPASWSPALNSMTPHPGGPAAGLRCQAGERQVSSPLLNEVRQGVRSRVRRPPGHNQPHDVLAVREPRQSTFRRILELFEEMLQRLQQRWRDALAWVQERAAACFRGLCRALEAFWSLVQSFCSSMGHAFRSVIQV
ncbi:interleukin-32 isoform X3 [Phacochoerus africanus]|uniref:interleukin-32 isoform X3 n=1 Tax=Phacochoerus africanus TaxID=41426 RepID=UPI001FDA5C59|nr:interleukin-32 isoform X3 [Phacochoerus africanus]